MKIVSFSILLMMVGCYNLNFDNLEYDRFIQIKESSEIIKQECSSPDVYIKIHDLKKLVDHQEFYTSNRRDRDEVKNSTAALKLMVDSIGQRQSFSSSYCSEKMDNISKASQIIINALGHL